MTIERKNKIIKDLIAEMGKMGYEVEEDEDCIAFRHIDGYTRVEFDRWSEVCEYIMEHQKGE